MKKAHILLLLLFTMIVGTMKANDNRPRVVIMTDAETDDRCSMVATSGTAVVIN